MFDFVFVMLLMYLRITSHFKFSAACNQPMNLFVKIAFGNFCFALTC